MGLLSFRLKPVLRCLMPESLRGCLPGAARQPLTFLVSPRKVSKRRRPHSRCPSGSRKNERQSGKRNNSPSLRSVLKQISFLIRFAVHFFGSVRADQKQKSLYTQSSSILITIILCFIAPAFAAPPQFAQVVPGKSPSFPRDFGSHPDYRNEWWYATGWLQTPDGKAVGFQVTFFRSATDQDADNPSKFAPKQLIIAHAALSDPAIGKLLHDQKIAREGFGLAYAKESNTDVKLDNWYFIREADGRYRTTVEARDFAFTLSLVPTQTPMLQDDHGFSRKGPKPEQASYYYSEPHLKVTGRITRMGKEAEVTGVAWLDHEWSTSVLDPDAAGWDWIGANLDDGSALMAFQIRGKDRSKLWAHATLRDSAGNITTFQPDQVRFLPQRRWRSPRTNASYPVATLVETGPITWQITPLQDDQELDSRQSVGAVYWEGAVTISRDGKQTGRGYLEMTGYVKPMKL